LEQLITPAGSIKQTHSAQTITLTPKSKRV